ncbi:MAG: DUF4334 domain-containing protein [bacterium]
MEKFEKIISQKEKISYKELDEFFASLEPIKIDEMIGEWKIGYFFTDGIGSKWEIFIRNFPIIRPYSKKFLDQNNVKAWVYRFFGIKFSIPGASAILRKVEFRNKVSTSMIYNYLPMIDNFRKVDDNTVMGIMETKGKVSLYFYFKK